MRSLILFLLTATLGTSVAQSDVTLVIWGEPNTVGCITGNDDSERCSYAHYINDTWAEMHPNIKLKWEEHGWDETLRQNLVTAQLGGVAPDITVGESFIPALVSNGSLAPLTISQEALDNIVPGTVAAATKDGQVYGVPALTAVFALEVNADVVREAGLDPDTLDLSTWDKVEEVAAEIAQAGNESYYGFSILGQTPFPAAALFRAAPYIYQTGADFCAEGCTEPTFNDPRSVKAYQWFRDMYQYTPPGLAFNGDEGFVFAQLFDGLTAMQTAGAWHPTWAKSSGCDDCRYLPLPTPDEGGQPANVVVGNPIYAVLESSDHKDEAMMFLEWLIDQQVQLNVFWAWGSMPATKSALQAITEVANGDLTSVPDYYSGDDAQALASVYSNYINELLTGDVRILPPWANNGPELNTLWNDMFAEVLTSDKPVQDILDNYQAQAEALVR